MKKFFKNTFKFLCYALGVILALSLIVFLVIIGIKTRIRYWRWIIGFPTPWNVIAIVVSILIGLASWVICLLILFSQKKQSSNDDSQNCDDQQETEMQ